MRSSGRGINCKGVADRFQRMTLLCSFIPRTAERSA